MEIVIKIPDRIAYGVQNGITKNGSIASKIVLEAVKNGTPLPKGHGRLIDADAIESLLRNKGFDKARSPKFYEIVWAQKQVHNAQTIIEADKEVDDGDSN